MAHGVYYCYMYTTKQRYDTILTQTAMYIITGNSEGKFCQIFLKVFHNFHQIFNGIWITSVCATLTLSHPNANFSPLAW